MVEQIPATYNTYAYRDYIDGVLNGTIVSGEYIKLACKRAKEWENRTDIYFDEEDVQRRIRFIWRMKHNTDTFAGKHFELLPWQ